MKNCIKNLKSQLSQHFWSLQKDYFLNATLYTVESSTFQEILRILRILILSKWQKNSLWDMEIIIFLISTSRRVESKNASKFWFSKTWWYHMIKFRKNIFKNFEQIFKSFQKSIFLKFLKKNFWKLFLRLNFLKKNLGNIWKIILKNFGN